LSESRRPESGLLSAEQSAGFQSQSSLGPIFWSKNKTEAVPIFEDKNLPLTDFLAHRNPGTDLSGFVFKCSMDGNKSVLGDEFQFPETNSASFV